MLMVLGIWIVFATGYTYRVSRIAQMLRGPLRTGGKMDLSARIPREQAVPLIDLVRQQFPQMTTAQPLANTVRQVWERIHLRPPGLFASLGLLAVYVGGFLAAPIVLTVAAWPGTPAEDRWLRTTLNQLDELNPAIEVELAPNAADASATGLMSSASPAWLTPGAACEDAPCAGRSTAAIPPSHPSGEHGKQCTLGQQCTDSSDLKCEEATKRWRGEARVRSCRRHPVFALGAAHRAAGSSFSRGV
jgi:hypothetical protein